MSFSRDSKLLVSINNNINGSNSSLLTIWNVESIYSNSFKDIKSKFYFDTVIYFLKFVPLFFYDKTCLELENLELLIIQSKNSIFLYDFVNDKKTNIFSTETNIYHIELSKNKNIISVIVKNLDNTSTLNVFEIFIRSIDEILIKNIMSKNYKNDIYSYFSNDSKLIIVVDYDSISILDLEKDELIYSINQINSRYSYDLISTLSSSNKYLSYSDVDGFQISIIDIESGLKVKELAQNSDYYNSILFINDKTFISSSSQDFIIWDLENMTADKIFGITEADCLAYNPIKNIIAYGTKKIKIFDLNLYKEILEIESNTQRINKITFIPEKELIAICSTDKKIKICNCLTGEQFLELTNHTDSVNDLFYLKENYSIISVGDDGFIIEHTLTTGKELNRIYLNDKIEIIEKNNNYFACVLKNHSIIIFNYNFEKIITLKNTSEVTDIKFIENNTLVSSHYDGMVKFWNIKTGTNSEFYSNHSLGISKIALNENIKFFITGGNDLRIKVWNYKSFP
ncbi:MAG: hypothetical protein U0354_07120 [Candidatus Sericytochromatia bacterium]